MTSSRVYIDHLRRAPFFEAFSRRDLEKIAKASDEVAVPAGSVILEQGREGYEAYMILSGTVVVKRNGRKVATLTDGAMLGELSLLDHGQRSATAICETDCTLLVLTQGTFMGVVADVPLLMHKLFVSLVGRIRELDELSLG